ncbi:MFS transporter [SAR202 cluster bacterium AD-804-J14_MRT_500m]|nr:MFS transporter [SAR202 cluster bacterium AD-804-J14_MRT_500m]
MEGEHFEIVELLGVTIFNLFTGHRPWAKSLEYRDFRILWGSTAIHSLAMGMEQVAMAWLIIDMTDSPFLVGVAVAARMAPMFFLGILAGAMADWLDRRVFLPIATAMASIVAGAMAALLITNSTAPWHVIVLAGCSGSAMAFVMTIRQAYAFDIVGPKLSLNGLALNMVALQVGGIVGGLLAGALIALIGMGMQYIVISIAYVAAALVLLSLSARVHDSSPERETVLQSFKGALQLIRTNRTILTLMCMVAVTEVLAFSQLTLLPVFAKDVLDVGPLGLGAMNGARQAGGMVGLLALAGLGNFRRKGLLLFLTNALTGFGQLIFYVTPDLITFLLVLAAVNACLMAADTLYKTIMQENVSNDERGRAMGCWILSIGVAPVGHISIGAVASVLSARVAFLIFGGTMAAATIGSFLTMKNIRNME